MSKFRISRNSDQSFSLYRNEMLLIFGLDEDDAKELRTLIESKQIENDMDFARLRNVKQATTNIEADLRKIHQGGRRPLILKDHVDTIRAMVEQNPAMTKQDIMRRLHRQGVRFSSVTAVTNAARLHGIKLSA